MIWLLGIAALLIASTAGAADVRGALHISGEQAQGAVVYLEPAEVMMTRPAPRRVVMDQKNLTFIPSVLPVVRGTTVEFTNSDDVQHNVFTPSAIAGRFNLGLYNRGEARSVTLAEAGDVVILCNIHMEMEAHILVLDAPYFAQVDSGGDFEITDVPAGKYTLRVWQRKWLSETRPVQVTDGGPANLQVQVRH